MIEEAKLGANAEANRNEEDAIIATYEKTENEDLETEQNIESGNIDANEKIHEKNIDTSEKGSSDEKSDDQTLQSITINQTCSSTNAVCWSQDGSLAVLTDKRIYVYRLSPLFKERRLFGFNLTFNTTVINNIPSVYYDTQIDKSNFKKRCQDSFTHRQAYLLDKARARKENKLNGDQKRYVKMAWSPCNATRDTSCVLATVSACSNVYVHSLSHTTGRWLPVLNISQLLHTYLVANAWLEDRSTGGDKFDNFRQHGFRSELLNTTALTWSPADITCDCMRIKSDDADYLECFKTYARCSHSKFLLFTASQNGYVFAWMLTFDLLNEKEHQAEIILWWKTRNEWPVSISTHQPTQQDYYLAVGFSNGLLNVYHVVLSDTQRSQQNEVPMSLVKTLPVWAEPDQLKVSLLQWIVQESSLQLTAAKESEIVVFTFAMTTTEEGVSCTSCEIAPSHHSTPINSLQVVENTYIMTSSSRMSQYFDVVNKSSPVIDTNILRGFKCMGAAVDGGQAIFVRVVCPDRLLLLQKMFVRQLEISFLPFLPIDVLCTRLLQENADLSMSVRELISLTSASTEDLLLPNPLHKYCDAPGSLYGDLEPRELHLYLFFNRVRFNHQHLSDDALMAQPDEDTDALLVEIKDNIERAYVRKTLLKALQFVGNGWLPVSPQVILIVALMADWLVISERQTNVATFKNADTLNIFDLSEKCYELFDDKPALVALQKLKDEEMLKLCRKANKIEQNASEATLQDEEKSAKNINNVGNGKDNENSLQIQTEIKAPKDNKIEALKSPTKNVSPSRKIKSNKKVESTNSEILQSNNNKTIETKTTRRDWPVFRQCCDFCEKSTLAMKNYASVTCVKKHVSPRCALTLRVLSTGRSRRCSGCDTLVGAKVIEGQLSLEAVLLNVDLCPFCGCRFVETGAYT